MITIKPKWTLSHEKKSEIKGREIIASIYLNRMAERYFESTDHLLSGIITISVFCIGFFKENKIMNEMIVYIAFIVGILKIFQASFNLRGKASVYQTTRKSYEDIVDYITETLAESRRNRKIDPDQFMKQLVKDINGVNKNAPAIYDFITKKFYKKYKNLRTAKPLTINQIEIIINNSEEEDINNDINTDIHKEAAASVIQDTWKKHKGEEQDKKNIKDLFAKEMMSRISKKASLDDSLHFEMRRLQQQDEKSED